MIPVSFVLIISFLKNVFNRKANIKIESAVSSGSNWNYMKNVNYLW